MAEALQYVAKHGQTKLMGPTDLMVKRRSGHVGVSVAMTSGGYRVVFVRTRITVPVNSPKLLEPSVVVGGDGGEIGGYALQEYSATRLVRRALSGMWNGDPWTVPKKGGQRIDLGSHFEGVVYGSRTTRGRGSIVEFTVGGWTYYSQAMSTTTLLRQARSLLPALRALPHDTGRVVITDAGDGDHALVAWVSGTRLLSTTSVRSPLQAIRMASTMTTWSTKEPN